MSLHFPMPFFHSLMLLHSQNLNFKHKTMVPHFPTFPDISCPPKERIPESIYSLENYETKFIRIMFRWCTVQGFWLLWESKRVSIGWMDWRWQHDDGKMSESLQDKKENILCYQYSLLLSKFIASKIGSNFPVHQGVLRAAWDSGEMWRIWLLECSYCLNNINCLTCECNVM